MVRGVEIPIDDRASAVEMAETIFGDGVQVVSASYIGDNDSPGMYPQGNSISPGVMPSDTGVMFSTGDLNGFTNSTPCWSGNSNQSMSTTTNSSGPNNDPLFNAAAGTNTYDASYLDVDFNPTGDVMTMQFVFATEGFPEYATGAFQDFVGVWVNGTQVPLSVGDGDIDPNNLNAGSNANLFVDNTSDQYNTEMDGFTVTMTLTITQINGQDVVAGSVVTLNSVPCFVKGSRIQTERGDVPVEQLREGDLVLTRDDGFQMLRWVGHREVLGMGAYAPIRIWEGAFGDHNELWLSPLHRVLIRDSLAELLFGEREVLVAAKDLVNDRSVRRVEVDTVDYFHLLFDRHKVIVPEGLPTESFMPEPQIKNSFEAEIVHELCELFPELDIETAEGYSPAARRMLRGFETQILSRKWAA